jgi:hypothetical protein
MDESKAELDSRLNQAYHEWLQRPTPETMNAYVDMQKTLIDWKQKFRGVHLNWIYEKESAGVPAHQWSLVHGPQHPNSYLLYNDSGILIFPRDQADRYSSYTFWLQHLTDEEPIHHLGQDFFSAKELGLSPALIGEYYQLQQVFLHKGATKQSDIDRIQALHDQIQMAFSKLDGKGSQVNK